MKTYPHNYEQWNNDAIVYSLFNNSSQQSSLRQIDYKGKKWDIFNHFFFMSIKQMKTLAIKYKFQELLDDLEKHGKGERYVYTILQTTTLTEPARAVLKAAKALVRQSFKDREEYNSLHPEQYLQAWDGGWAQLKPMLKEHYKEDYDKFIKLYKDFEDYLRPGVYQFGFLLNNPDELLSAKSTNSQHINILNR